MKEVEERLGRCAAAGTWTHDQAVSWWQLHIPDTLNTESDDDAEFQDEAGHGTIMPKFESDET